MRLQLYRFARYSYLQTSIMSNPPAYTPTPNQHSSNGVASKSQIHMQPPQSPMQPQYPVQPTVQPPMRPPSMAMPQSGMQPSVSTEQAGEQYRTQLFAQCAQGIHDPHTKYGVCGIITAVVFPVCAGFPIGLICLFTDTEQRCHRCGVRLDNFDLTAFLGYNKSLSIQFFRATVKPEPSLFTPATSDLSS
ncbi:hypothetical protein J3R30DRAFT_860171 [Lentinula aciculospora]|uniref:Brain protein I3 n=1 Tax=Lentinula aciculospora TaxID=153920 RepID=A0A9W9DV31_9AGAR|nr:hypothetical protein J3R30DRAFT_860171 [Lentinula aciculospora]